MGRSGKQRGSSTSNGASKDARRLPSGGKALACDLSGLKAGGADVLTLAIAGDHGLDPLDIWIPSSACTTLGVRDIVAKARTLATDIAY